MTTNHLGDGVVPTMATPLIGAPGPADSLFSGVFRRLDEADITSDLFAVVGTSCTVLIVGDSMPSYFAGYELKVLEAEPCILGRCDQTRMVPLNESREFNSKIVELCAGTGGMGVGCSQLNGQVVASLDFNSLACEQLRLNGRDPVLCADICSDAVKGSLHALVGPEATCVMAGFPCPPHSTQGMGLGAADPRHQVLVEVLRAAYMLQVHSVVLECTPQAQFDRDVRGCLWALADLMDFQICDNTLVLSHQWPSRRHRWWTIMCPMSWGLATLPKWPESDQFSRIATLFPYWGCWSDCDELDLRLDEQELAAFHTEAYGSDQRVLTLEDRAPTLLHSYGSALKPCPCGCREQAFAIASLLRKGLRGCYVFSELDGAPRFLHPQEMGALLGFPSSMDYVNPPRSALCLLGLVASPLQALWTYSCLLSSAGGLDIRATQEAALDALTKFQRDLVAGYARQWASQPALPGFLCVHADQEPDRCIKVWGSTTVADLIQAEQFACDPGSLLGLYLADLPLPANQRLAPLRFRDDCSLRMHSVLPPPASPSTLVLGLQFDDELQIHFISSGDFLFQVLVSCGHAASDILAVFTLDNLALPLDSRLWRSMQLCVHLRPVSAVVAFGLQPGSALGLSASTIHAVARALFQLRFSTSQSRPLLGHPMDLHQLVTQGWTSAQCTSFRSAYELSNGSLFLLVPLKDHWYLFWGFMQDFEPSWIGYDGLRQSDYSAALDFVETINHVLAFPFRGCTTTRLYTQAQPHTCGTVALIHLSLLFGLRQDFSCNDELALHQTFLGLPSPSNSLLAYGVPSADPTPKLITLLQDKGVPEDAAAARAQDVLKSLGVSTVMEALAAKNPWAALKSLASRPSSRLRLVLEHELRQHIDQQAKKRGGHVPNAKSKKTPKGQAKSLPPVDPDTLQLVPGSFVDEEGDALPQIPFNQVGNDAHGLAFCTYRDAQPFIEAGSSISSTTLGLLLNTEVPDHLWQAASMEAIRFPAICAATSEPLLIQGTLVTLSDGAIHRPKSKLPDLPVQDSDVLKLQVFRDEVTATWDDWVAGPIRQLMQAMPIFKLCPQGGTNCGPDCQFYHAPIDETVHNVIMDVWSRGFFNTQGRTTKPGQAAYFQCLLRVPTVALETLLRTIHPGVYLEPRESSSRGPHSEFQVIWFSGQSREHVLHRLKTGTYGLGLARLHSRYGIRVKASHAARAHAELKPDEEFCDVTIKRVFTIFPIPHGVTRQQLQQLLQAWKWDARPLQALRGNHEGQSWTIGSSVDPPSQVLHGFDRDLLITLQKDMAAAPQHEPKVVASTRTKRFLKEGSAASSSTSDPWLNGPDPWKPYQATTPAPATSTVKTSAAAATRMDQITKNLREELVKPGLEATELAKLHQLEVSVTELTAQGQQFQQWFHDAGTRMGQTEERLQHLQQYVELQGSTLTNQIAQVQEEVTNKTELLQGQLHSSLSGITRDLEVALDSKLSTQFDRFEALLAKKAKTDNSS